jgi:general secretion pathway protein A
MYEDFFGLKGRPFELSPDPFFLFSSERTSEALASISYAVARRKGFVVLTGEVGTGKTLLLRCLFESWEREDIPFAYIIGPRLSTVDFLSYITFELGIKVAEPTKGNLLRALYGFLLDQFERGLTTVLVIDEAHQIPRSVLEEIRMLANFETAQQKLIQVLLVGQPELDKKLEAFELRSLKQRIAARCQLQPLREQEIGSYVVRRLELSGADKQGTSIFPVETIGAIYRYSGGIPRLVNNICDQALILAYTRKVRVVPVEVIDAVASHLRLNPGGGLKQTKSLLLPNQIENAAPAASSYDLPAVNLPAAEIRNPEPISSFANETPTPEIEAPALPPDMQAVSDTSAFVNAVNQTRAERSAWVSALTDGPGFLAPAVGPSMRRKPGMDSAMASAGRRVTSSFNTIFSSMRRPRSRRATVVEKGRHASSRVRRAILVMGAFLALILVGAAGGYLFSGQFQTFVRTDALGASPLPATEAASFVETPPAVEFPAASGQPPTSPVAPVARPAEGSQASIPSVAPTQRDVAPETQRNDLTIARLQTPVRRASPLASVSAEPPLIIAGAVGDFGGQGSAASLVAGAGTSPAPPPAPASVRPAAGGRLEPPQLISSTPPVYPPNARAQRVQGTVTLDALVDETGTVVETTVLVGPAPLHAAATQAVRTWKYQPARMNGQPVPIHVKVTVRFTLN